MYTYSQYHPVQYLSIPTLNYVRTPRQSTFKACSHKVECLHEVLNTCIHSYFNFNCSDAKINKYIDPMSLHLSCYNMLDILYKFLGSVRLKDFFLKDIKLIKRDSKDMCNVRNDLYFE